MCKRVTREKAEVLGESFFNDIHTKAYIIYAYINIYFNLISQSQLRNLCRVPFQTKVSCYLEEPPELQLNVFQTISAIVTVLYRNCSCNTF